MSKQQTSEPGTLVSRNSSECRILNMDTNPKTQDGRNAAADAKSPKSSKQSTDNPAHDSDDSDRWEDFFGTFLG